MNDRAKVTCYLFDHGDCDSPSLIVAGNENKILLEKMSFPWDLYICLSSLSVGQFIFDIFNCFAAAVAKNEIVEFSLRGVEFFYPLGQRRLRDIFKISHFV
ncbi:hypothetical protein NPIL_237501 [Nephila pilipes]|uniref:Uncharacterized protein n=1 Tax=Nephila pilipes TaxID=299642 RepID=A0A8X6TZ04_NEPPI|nr:hypothetical protein NPIL_237501 [Nephila pilipes]